MQDDVELVKKDCLVTANELRDDCIESIQDLCDDLEKSLRDLRQEQTETLNSKLRAARDAIRAATEQADEAICEEADLRVAGESEASKEREKAQKDIKKLYYEEANTYNPYELKEKITHRVIEFERYVGDNGRSFGDFVDDQVAIVER